MRGLKPLFDTACLFICSLYDLLIVTLQVCLVNLPAHFDLINFILSIDRVFSESIDTVNQSLDRAKRLLPLYRFFDTFLLFFDASQKPLEFSPLFEHEIPSSYFSLNVNLLFFVSDSRQFNFVLNIKDPLLIVKILLPLFFHRCVISLGWGEAGFRMQDDRLGAHVRLLDVVYFDKDSLHELLFFVLQFWFKLVEFSLRKRGFVQDRGPCGLVLKLLRPVIQSLERACHSFGIKFWLFRLILRLYESLFCGLLGFKHFGCLVNLLIQLGGSNTSEHGLILLKLFDFIEFVSSVFYLQTRLSLIVEHKPFVIRHVFVRSMNTKDFSQKFGRLQSLVHLFQ